MFYVFDCHEAQGYLCKVPFLWLAHVVAVLSGPRFDHTSVRFESDAAFARLTF